MNAKAGSLPGATIKSGAAQSAKSFKAGKLKLGHDAIGFPGITPRRNSPA